MVAEQRPPPGLPQLKAILSKRCHLYTLNSCHGCRSQPVLYTVGFQHWLPVLWLPNWGRVALVLKQAIIYRFFPVFHGTLGAPTSGSMAMVVWMRCPHNLGHWLLVPSGWCWRGGLWRCGLAGGSRSVEAGFESLNTHAMLNSLSPFHACCSRCVPSASSSLSLCLCLSLWTLASGTK